MCLGRGNIGSEIILPEIFEDSRSRGCIPISNSADHPFPTIRIFLIITSDYEWQVSTLEVLEDPCNEYKLTNRDHQLKILNYLFEIIRVSIRSYNYTVVKYLKIYFNFDRFFWLGEGPMTGRYCEIYAVLPIATFIQNPTLIQFNSKRIIVLLVYFVFLSSVGILWKWTRVLA